MYWAGLVDLNHLISINFNIVSILIYFLSLTIKKMSVLWESKCVLSRQNISSVQFRSVVLKVDGIG